MLGNTTGRRPGDVMFPLWTEGKALVIDVAVTSSLIATYERLLEPCEWNAATQKHGKYDADFKGTFCAMIFETLGAVNVEGKKSFVSYFASLPNVLVVSLLLIVVGHGHECRAIFSGLLRNLF